MPAYKDKAKGTWYVSFYYENWTGKKEKKMKRGFKTRREALEWERIFLQQKTSDLNMTFEDFVPLYIADMKNRFKESTWLTKEHIIRTKLVSYFGKRKMCDICSKDVMAWQNEMMGHRSEAGKAYSPVYLKTLHNQLSAVFNHAVRHYGLKANPAAQAGNMGKAKNSEMQFWTKAEYLQFIEAMMDKPRSFYAFEMLYWTGIRVTKYRTTSKHCMLCSRTTGYFKSRNHTYSARWSAAARKPALSASRCMVYATRIFLC